MEHSDFLELLWGGGYVWCGAEFGFSAWIIYLPLFLYSTLFCACPYELKVSFAVVKCLLFQANVLLRYVGSPYIGLWQVVGA